MRYRIDTYERQRKTGSVDIDADNDDHAIDHLRQHAAHRPAREHMWLYDNDGRSVASEQGWV